MGSNDRTVASAPIPGGSHILQSTGEPGDLSLCQSFLDETGEQPLDSLADSLAEVIAGGKNFGVCKLTNAFPPGLSLLKEQHTPTAIHLIFADEEDTERFHLTLLRHVWPATITEPESLSILIGRHSPELIACLETSIQWRNYLFGFILRMPDGPNAFEMIRTHVAAHSFSHEDKILLGQTIRYLHDSLLMSLPHEWVPAAEISRQLQERLDGFVVRAPELTEYEPWIRECYDRLTGEMFVQRIHGNLSCENIWFNEDHWIIGNWEGDVRLPQQERHLSGSPLYDLAVLYRSIFCACHDSPAWCEKAMESIFEGYGEPILTLPFSLFVLDTICEEIAGLRTPPEGNLSDPLEFLAWFQADLLANLDRMEPSAFQREV